MPPPSELFLHRWSVAHAFGMLAALGVAIATRQPTVLAVGSLSLAFLFGRGRARDDAARMAGFGVANTVTIARVLLVSVGLFVASRSPTLLGVIALVSFTLDGIDGWVARRLGEASSFGAKLDVEADAFVMLALCAALVTPRPGAWYAPWWVLAAGVIRYAYVAWRACVGVTTTIERRSRLGRSIFFVTMSSLVLACFPLPDRLRVLGLEIGTFAVLSSFVVDFRLLARERWRPRGVLVLGVALNLALFLPTTIFVDAIAGRDALHLGTEWVALVALVALTTRTRIASAVRWLGAVLYVTLLLFLFYHHGYLFFFHRPPAIVSDVRLLVHLFHLVKGDLTWSLLSLAALVGLGLLVMVVAAFFRQLQLAVADVKRAHVLAAGLGAVGAAAVSLAWTGIEREPPVVQLVSKHIAENAKFSRVRRDMERALAVAPPDLRYEVFLRPVLVRKPNVHLLMVEAYGQVLAKSEMRDAYREMLDDLDARLAERGHTTATSYSTSTVWGGSSWLAISTVQTGVRIENQDAYEVLEAASGLVPSLTSFFRAQGYTTVAIMPGNTTRVGLKRFDLFGRDIVLEAPELRYHGKRYGFGAPDQWSLSFFRENVLTPGPSPRFVHFMSVSTHWPWDETPPYAEDWHALNEPGARAIAPPRRAGLARVKDPSYRRYLATVEYDLAVLRDYILAENDDDALFVIMGDHQPCVEGAPDRETPVHVVSRDAALVERFRARGFSRQLFAEPEAVTHVDHAAIFSLVASVLAEHAGDGTKLPYFANGLPTSALKR